MSEKEMGSCYDFSLALLWWTDQMKINPHVAAKWFTVYNNHFGTSCLRYLFPEYQERLKIPRLIPLKIWKTNGSTIGSVICNTPIDLFTRFLILKHIPAMPSALTLIKLFRLNFHVFKLCFILWEWLLKIYPIFEFCHSLTPFVLR